MSIPILRIRGDDGQMHDVPAIRGAKGENGVDGISPTVSVSDIAGGHRVTIAGAAGTVSFDVMDGVTPEGAITEETDPTVPAWAKAADKPTYTAAEVGAIAKTGGTMTGVLTNTNGGYTLERGNLIVGKNDSTNKNYVRMYRVHPTSGAVMRSDYQLSDGGSIKYDLYHGSEQKNSMMLAPDYTSFGKPVDVTGGGTGVKSYEALAAALGIGAAAMSILDGDLSEPMSDDELTEKILNGEVSA